MSETGPDLRWNVEQRLQFIEFRFFWEGMVRRKDLTEQFKISVPQASADLAEYQRQAPGNTGYDSSRKAYVPLSEFKPRFYEPSTGDYFTHLRQIADGIAGKEGRWPGWVPPFDSVPLVQRRASPTKLRKVLYAMRSGRTLYIQYQSVSRPEPTRRWITPHGLGFDGSRWHVRAWCHLREGFRDFVLARIIKVDKDRGGTVDPEDDVEWTQKVTFRIGPNPKLPAATRESIILDYGMTDGELSLATRVSLSWYVERHLGLDLDRYDVPPERQQIVLLNRTEIERVRKRLRERKH